MSDGLHDWQQAFVIKGDLRERHVVAFEQAAAAIPHVILSATNSYKHAYLCAAIKAEWIESPAVSFEEVTTKENGRTVRKDRYLYDGVDIDEMHPLRS